MTTRQRRYFRQLKQKKNKFTQVMDSQVGRLILIVYSFVLMYK